MRVVVLLGPLVLLLGACGGADDGRINVLEATIEALEEKVRDSDEDNTEPTATPSAILPLAATVVPAGTATPNVQSPVVPFGSADETALARSMLLTVDFFGGAMFAESEPGGARVALELAELCFGYGTRATGMAYSSNFKLPATGPAYGLMDVVHRVVVFESAEAAASRFGEMQAQQECLAETLSQPTMDLLPDPKLETGTPRLQQVPVPNAGDETKHWLMVIPITFDDGTLHSRSFFETSYVRVGRAISIVSVFQLSTISEFPFISGNGNQGFGLVEGAARAVAQRLTSADR